MTQINLALFQPDMPGNVGAAMRLCACLDVPLHIIEPCGFPWDTRKIRTAAMDYWDHVRLTRHESWDRFPKDTNRIILLTTKTDLPYYDFSFQAGDTLLCGRESAGVPESVAGEVHAHVTIPMQGAARSLNVINAAAMVLGEALRQTGS